jgi:3-isopropylmalate dehydrogenase
VLVRESTEGLFASRGKGVVENDAVARETLVITRKVSERLFDFAFQLARRRKQQGRPGIVTCVDKANVFSAFAFFRRMFQECAVRYPDIEARCAYVDATALDMVRKPWSFDVLVTENMFGDILSDLGAGLIGGMGVAPSADIGDEHAVFQPCHGSAPDIVGTGTANPTATFLSGAMMLEWLALRHGMPACNEAAHRLRQAVDDAFAGGKLATAEFGGSASTQQVTEAVLANLK